MLILTEGSLERRLIGRLAIVLLASFVLFAIVYSLLSLDEARFHAAEVIGDTATDMAAQIRATPGGQYVFDTARLRAAINWEPGMDYAAIALPSGAAVAGSSPDLVAALRLNPTTQLSTSELVDIDGGLQVRAMERIDSGGVRYRVALIRPFSSQGIQVLGLQAEFTGEIIPTFVPMLALALVVSWITIRVNLSPLRRASAEAAMISADQPGHRMSTQGMASEMRPLMDAINRALSSLEASIAAQKRFTANAAHELRTPLAILRARVDGMQTGPERAALTRDIDRLTRVVSQMLLAARLEAGQTGAWGDQDLALLVRDVIADLAPLAHSDGRDIELETLAQPHVQGSPFALESAVRNLIENALRFSPPGASVIVRVRAGAIVEVEDSGPGVAEADRPRIFEAFWRAHNQGGEGAGLGLAIVREVAELHGGSIAIEDIDAGGARFVLHIPQTPSGSKPDQTHSPLKLPPHGTFSAAAAT